MINLGGGRIDYVSFFIIYKEAKFDIERKSIVKTLYPMLGSWEEPTRWLTSLEFKCHCIYSPPHYRGHEALHSLHL